MIIEYIPYIQNFYHKYRARITEQVDEIPLGIGAIVDTEFIRTIRELKRGKRWSQSG